MTHQQATVAIQFVRENISVLVQALAEQHRDRDLVFLASILQEASKSCRDRIPQNHIGLEWTGFYPGQEQEG